MTAALQSLGKHLLRARTLMGRHLPMMASESLSRARTADPSPEDPILRPSTATWQPLGQAAFDEFVTVTRARRATDLEAGASGTRHARRLGMRATAFALNGSPSRDVLQALRSEAVRAVAGGSTTLFVDLDALTSVDSAVIGTLILILRAARECGAGVVLRAAHEPIVETLRVTALDKIFPIEAPVS